TVRTDCATLFATVTAHGSDRAEAVARMRRALREMRVAGLPRTLPFHRHVLAEPDFVAGRYDTGYVTTHWPPRDEPGLADDGAVAAAVVAVLARRERTLRAPHSPDDGAWARAAREDALRELPT